MSEDTEILKTAINAAIIFWSGKGESAEKEGNGALAYSCYAEAVSYSEQVLELEEDKTLGIIVDVRMKRYQESMKGLEHFSNLLDMDEDRAFAGWAFEQALEMDEKKLYDEAIKQYKSSCASYLKLCKSDPGNKSYKKRAAIIVDRLEKLAKIKNSVLIPDPAAGGVTPSVPVAPPIVTNPSGFVAPPLTNTDLEALKRGSKINGLRFEEYVDGEDTSKYFADKLKDGDQWTDPDGMLQLDPAQDEVFARWVRASKYFSMEGKPPRMISGVSAAFIKQSKVGDCSFVSSLCVTANYESRFNRQLITSIIYPQDKNGIPVFNPTGKYMVKLWFNGVHRRVFVDDFLPTGTDGTLTCSYSRRNELWVSIIEKAYVKVNGGYDFPGSNGGIDLYALTGWIPQTHTNSNIDRNKVWNELYHGTKRGSCLVTAGTPSLSREKEKKYGLASAHAYAVLNFAEIDGFRLVQMKNPWSKMSWKGKFSKHDTKNMTPKLRKRLNYGTEEDEGLDGGVFWIDFDSFCRHFEQTDVSWNPSVLPNRVVFHRLWTSYGPADDSLILAHNPQFRLSLTTKPISPSNPGTKMNYGVVWIVLSRHVYRKSQILSKKDNDALNLLVFDHRNGDLVLTPDKPVVEIKYTNYPHILCRLQVPLGVKKYSLVISSYKKDSKAKTGYSLQTMCSDNCFPNLIQIPNVLPIMKRVKGAWTERTAGGPVNNPRSFQKNPMFLITIVKSCKFRVRLLTHRTLRCHLTLYQGYLREHLTSNRHITESGEYKAGFCYVETDEMNPSLQYILCCSTEEKGQVGKIILEMESTGKFEVQVLN